MIVTNKLFGIFATKYTSEAISRNLYNKMCKLLGNDVINIGHLL